MHAEKRPYLQLLSDALATSKAVFNFPTPPAVNWLKRIDNDDVSFIDEVLNVRWVSDFADKIDPYWGNQCQFLSSHIAAFLTEVLGVPAEIIIGEVSINGTLEYDTTMDGLKAEYFADHPLVGNQQLHAWVSVGGDTIIDAAIAHRLARHYKVPARMLPAIMVGRASDFLECRLNFSASYQPMIYGTDFLDKTTSTGPSVLRPIYRELYADVIKIRKAS